MATTRKSTECGASRHKPASKKKMTSMTIPANDYWRVDDMWGYEITRTTSLAYAKEFIIARVSLSRFDMEYGEITHYKNGKPVAIVNYDTEGMEKTKDKVRFSVIQKVKVLSVNTKK